MQKGAIAQFWLRGIPHKLREYLNQVNVMDQMYLLEYELDDNHWKYCARPKSAEVFLDVCIAQNIESFQLQKVAVWCLGVAEYSDSRGTSLHNKAAPVWSQAKTQQEFNTKKCRDAMTALLGCCGKQRRVEGGTLRDISRVVAKTIWKTRRDDLWK